MQQIDIANIALNQTLKIVNQYPDMVLDKFTINTNSHELIQLEIKHKYANISRSISYTNYYLYQLPEDTTNSLLKVDLYTAISEIRDVIRSGTF